MGDIEGIEHVWTLSVSYYSQTMAKFPPPKEFSFIPGDWAAWKERFERYSRATKLSNEEESVRIDCLVYSMGEKADRIFKTFTYGSGESADKYDVVIKKFEQYFVLKRNVIYERSMFHARKQSESETVEQYFSDLHALVQKCSYPDEMQDEMLRDRLVLGLRDKDTQCKLYMEENLTIAKAVDIARQAELIRQQMNASAQGDIHEMKRSRERDKRVPFKPGQQKPAASQKGRARSCDNCGYPAHKDREKCPAIGKTCGKCHKKNHFRKKCRAKEVHEVIDDVPEQYAADDGGATGDYFFDAIDCPDVDAWYVSLKLRGTPVKFKIDTGADMTTIGRNVYDSMRKPPPLEAPDRTLRCVGGTLYCDGMFNAYVRRRDTVYKFRVAVIPESPCLLGRSVSEQMGLVQRMDSLECPTPSRKMHMRTDEVNISLKEGHTPYCAATPSKIAFPLMEPCRRELERMEANDIIEKVTEPTDWCARMVPVPKKSGEVRICVDLKCLNRAVRREHYPLYTLEDIAPRLAGSTVFSSLDAASGFWQIPLNEPSRKLTTFITPFGRYMFKRLPFGINSASEIFQRKMSELFENEPGIEVIIDDILVHGKTTEEHNHRLERALRILQDVGVILNMSKCRFRVPRLIYFGHLVGAEGVSPHPDKVAAIRDLPPPTNLSELKSVNGLFNYVSKFMPHLSSIMKPMTDLLKSDTAWVWGPPQEEAFAKAKDLLCSAPALSYYDPKLPTTVSADASSFGLGAVLLQQHDDDWKPVAFCSRTLTPTEVNWAQIEKECLAAVWACEKFSRYLVGLPCFRLETDHKPLVPLLTTKNLGDAPVRCQRLLMRMMRFNPDVHYVPGKYLAIADALSRKPLPDQNADITLDKAVEAHVEAVMSGWPASKTKLDEIRETSEVDPTLHKVAEYITDGWPNSSKSLPLSLMPFYRERGELSVVDGIVTKGTCIVIPRTMRAEILEKLHESHQGLTRTRQRTKNAVWWPGLSHDLQTMSDSCTTCKMRQQAQNHEPLQTFEPAIRPWSRVAVDLADYEGRDYLILVDAFSRWIEIKGMASTTSSAVIKKLREIFTIHGYPDEIHSDNGPQFASDQFRQYTKYCGSVHKTSSPYFHQSNGLVERAVQTAKGILSLDNPEHGLLDYRSTPCTVTGVSPAQCLMGRQLRTRVPVLDSQLRPQLVSPEQVRERDRRAKDSYKAHYDRRHGARELSPLIPDQPVLMRVDEEKRGWKRAAKVVSGDGGRSYLVQAPDGTIYRRNRKHLLPISQPLPDANSVAPPTPLPPTSHLGSSGPVPPLSTSIERPVISRAQPFVPPETMPESPAAVPEPMSRPRRDVKLPGHLRDYYIPARKWIHMISILT